MKLYVYLSCLLLILMSFPACKKKQTRNVRLLMQAQRLAEDDPSMALLLLDSIENPTISLKEDLYMEYIVAKTHIRFNNGLSIKDDTTKQNMEMAISYFEKHNNLQQLTLAYFYSGNLYNLREERESAFNSYKKTILLPTTEDNLLFKGKAYYNIGLYYYFNSIKDSAEINWQKSLKIFEKLDKKNNVALNLYFLAMVNYMQDYIDLSRKYAIQSLHVATEINDKRNLFNSTNLLGSLSREEKQYDEALLFFKEASKYCRFYIDSTKNYIGSAKTYLEMNNVAKAKNYIPELLQRLPQTTELYTLLSLNTTLSEYYAKTADAQKAKYYSEIANSVNDLIESRKITSKLYEIDKKATVDFYKKEKTTTQSKYVYINISAILSFVALFLCFRIRITKKIGLLNINIKQLKESR